MPLNSKEVAELLEYIRQTQDVEISCPECLDELDKYTQHHLDGAPIEGVLRSVREHLEACPCCTNQYHLVLETLKSIEE
jgi:uncharacterized protein with PIN domain